MTFEETLQNHLKAIKYHSTELLIPTLHVDQDIVCIEPDGQYINSHSTFLENQISWFSDRTWDIEIEILHTMEAAEMGVATTKLRITEVDATFSTILTLVFSKIGDKWGLVHDQNTPILAK